MSDSRESESHALSCLSRETIRLCVETTDAAGGHSRQDFLFCGDRCVTDSAAGQQVIEQVRKLLAAYDAMSMHTQDMSGVQHISVPVPLFRELLAALLSASPETQGLIEKWRARSRTVSLDGRDDGSVWKQAADELEAAGARGGEPQQEIEDMRARKDAAYEERNRVVAALSKLWPSHLAHHPDDDAGWERDWMTIVCIHSPMGQLTWHVHDSQVGLFAHLQQGENHWDGHSTEQKYNRLAALASPGSLQPEPAITGNTVTACTCSRFRHPHDRAEHNPDPDYGFAAAPPVQPEPSEQPKDSTGRDRLLLNAYGRKCYDAGQRSMLDSSCQVQPEPWQGIESAPQDHEAEPIIVWADGLHLATRGFTAELRQPGWFDERGWKIHPTHWMRPAAPGAARTPKGNAHGAP